MNWFFSRRKRQGEYPEEVGITTGPHRSPGLTALSEELDRREVGAILDLGASSNENVVYMSRYCANIVIRDVVSAQGEERSAPRASLFELEVDAFGSNDGTRFDAVLLWDLVHYVDRPRLEQFAGRLAEVVKPGALALLLASESTPIPMTPVHFKIRDRHSLLYEVQGTRRSPAPHFTPREVENLMKGFRPLRFFQLRNGLQEFLLQYEEAPVEKEAPVEEEAQPKPAKPAPKQPGDWY